MNNKYCTLNLCKYKDIFGKPNEEIHSYRLFDFAIVDVGLTLLFGYFIYKKYGHSMWGRASNYNLYTIWLILFIFAIVIHKIFCVKTKLNNLIFD
jgi:hypothetical protein